MGMSIAVSQSSQKENRACAQKALSRLKRRSPKKPLAEEVVSHGFNFNPKLICPWFQHYHQ